MVKKAIAEITAKNNEKHSLGDHFIIGIASKVYNSINVKVK